MADITRVLVTGSGGQVGNALLALPWPGPFRVEGRSRAALDITDRAAVESALAGGCGLVVNAAAYTAVDRAESEPEAAHAVNGRGVRHLAEACAAAGAAMIHVSSDYVFDGAKDGPYREDDPIGPLGVYGDSKAAGEAALRRTLARHVILRTAWLHSARGSNFVRTILRLAAEREALRVVADQHGSPTSAGDLARAIVAVAERIARDAAEGAEAPWGTYHCANRGATTWHGLAEEIVARAGPWLDRSPAIVPIATADHPTPARRPANSRLDCGRLERHFGVRLRPWREALRDVLEELRRARRQTVTLEEEA